MSRILRHIKEGFLGVTRHFALSLSSISSVTVTLVIMGVFLMISSNLNEITKSLTSSVQIHVQIKQENEDQASIDRIQAAIQALPNVATVEFSNKDEELEAFIQLNDAEDAEEMFGPMRGENNPMLNAFLVQASSGDSLKEVSDNIAAIDGVFKSTYGGGATQTFVNVLDQVRNVGFVIVFGLGAIAIFLISNTIRVSIHSRRREISIMRTVGATNWYIRWPFIIEGMIIGLIGAILPILLTIFGYKYLFELTGGFLFTRLFSLVAVTPLVYEISGILALIGIFVGALGSIFSVGKFLRWTR